METGPVIMGKKDGPGKMTSTDIIIEVTKKVRNNAINYAEKF